MYLTYPHRVVVRVKLSALSGLLALASEGVKDSNRWTQTQTHAGDITFYFADHSAAIVFLTKCTAKGIPCRLEKAQRHRR
jgi:hypothetical protein